MFILSFQKNYNFIATLSGQKSVVKYLSAKNNTYLINYCRIYFTQIVFQNNCSQKNKTVIKKRKTETKEGIDMLDEIVAAGAVSDAHLRMLVEKIVINEKKGKLKIKIKIRAKFSSHIDFIPDENDPMYQNMSPYLIEV